MKYIPSSCLLLFTFYLPSEGTCICFRLPLHVSGYFWIRNFFFADSVSVNTYPVNQVCESASFWICSPDWTFLNTWIQNRVDAKSGYVFFIPWHNKIEPSSVPLHVILYSRGKPRSQPVLPLTRRGTGRRGPRDQPCSSHFSLISGVILT